MLSIIYSLLTTLQVKEIIDADAKFAETIRYLIVGGGIVGLTVSREHNMLHPGAQIAILEKENSLGEHVSGRNSGVLHSYLESQSMRGGRAQDEVVRAGARYKLST